MDLMQRKNYEFVIPKSLKLSSGEELYVLNTAAKTGVPPQVIVELARKERIPVVGLTFFNGVPYINVTGLDAKIQNKCKDEHLILKSVEVNLTQKCHEDTQFRASAIATVKFFDKLGFQAAFEKLDPANISTELLVELKEVFTQIFTDVGEASPDSCQGIAWSYKKVGHGEKVRDKLLTENIDLMASRRASNRGKRLATGTGLTSLDEVPITDPIIAAEVMGQREANEDQIKQINELKANSLITKSEKKLVDKRIENVKTEADALIVIKGLEDMINARAQKKSKKAEKQQELPV